MEIERYKNGIITGHEHKLWVIGRIQVKLAVCEKEGQYPQALS